MSQAGHNIAKDGRNSFVLSKLVVVGAGLIGGSFALALKRAGVVREVVGLGRSEASLQQAVQLGVIDRASTDWAEALADASLVMLAMPVGQMTAVMQRIAPLLGAQTVVTDAGSTKADVVSAAFANLGAAMANFVPGHPVAGAEKSGASAARADLYEQRCVVLTPLPQTHEAAVQCVRTAWQVCGARVFDMSPDQHDRVLAGVSHLPHLLSFALVHELAQRPDAQQYFDLAAGGFRDFTRIAASHPEMWRDIVLANRSALLAELDCYEADLRTLRALIEQGDGDALHAYFERSRTARLAWAEQQAKITQKL